MTVGLTQVTGREARSGNEDALDALIDFYEAFNTRDHRRNPHNSMLAAPTLALGPTFPQNELQSAVAFAIRRLTPRQT